MKRLSYSQLWWLLTSAIAVAIVFGLGTLDLIRSLALLLAAVIFGLSVAAALSPLVNWMSRHIPRLLAILLSYILLLALFGGLLWFVIPSLANQLTDFSSRIPNLIDSGLSFFGNLGVNISGNSFVDSLVSNLNSLGPLFLSLPLTITSALSGIILILFISFYTLVEISAMQTFFLSLFPEERRPRMNEIVTAMAQAMGGYVRGVIINGVIMGFLTFLGLELLGINFALTFGVMTGMLELIPVAGPVFSGVIIVTLTLFQSPWNALIALIFLVVLQQVEGHILVPNIMQSETEVSPLISILALFGGAVIGGLVGALIAIPIAAALHVLVRLVIAPAIRRQTGAQPPGDSP